MIVKNSVWVAEGHCYEFNSDQNIGVFSSCLTYPHFVNRLRRTIGTAVRLARVGDSHLSASSLSRVHPGFSLTERSVLTEGYCRHSTAVAHGSSVSTRSKDVGSESGEFPRSQCLLKLEQPGTESV